MDYEAESARVFVAPDSFKLAELFQAATVLDSDDYEEDATGNCKPPLGGESEELGSDSEPEDRLQEVEAGGLGVGGVALQAPSVRFAKTPESNGC